MKNHHISLFGLCCVAWLLLIAGCHKAPQPPTRYLEDLPPTEIPSAEAAPRSSIVRDKDLVVVEVVLSVDGDFYIGNEKFTDRQLEQVFFMLKKSAVRMVVQFVSKEVVDADVARKVLTRFPFLGPNEKMFSLPHVHPDR